MKIVGWTDEGEIDRQKFAETFLKESEHLRLEDKYAIACTFYLKE